MLDNLFDVQNETGCAKLTVFFSWKVTNIFEIMTNPQEDWRCKEEWIANEKCCMKCIVRNKNIYKH